MTTLSELFQTSEPLRLLFDKVLLEGEAINLNNKRLTTLEGRGIPDIVQGHFNCQSNLLSSLEFSPQEVEGTFSCATNQLTSLKYLPKKLQGSFYCSNNQLTSLEYCPTTIKGDFWCFNNKLSSLEHCPQNIQGTFSCATNQLTSLKYCPKVINSDFNCSRNKLTSLEYGPKEVKSNFKCYDNQLTSLEHCPTKVNGNFYCSRNQLTSLQDIHLLFKDGYINGCINIAGNPIKSHILGLILIPKLAAIIYKQEQNKDLILACEIINKHLAGNRDVWVCQEELLDNDLHEFAQL